ncbi:phage head completion protein [Flavitalea sp.]|nr:head-tail adaptor protein [Flavitalea sp.]
MAVVTGSMFKEPCRLENPTKEADDAGGHAAVYEHFLTTRGYFQKKMGFNSTEEGYNQIVNEYRAYIWWRNDIEANITKDTRFIRDNREYSIITWNRYKENRMFLEFTLIEIL